MIEGYFRLKGKMGRERRVVRPFHKQIFSALDRWFSFTLPDGKRNLAICIPPRHTKTTLARDCVELGLCLAPDSEFIYTSYSATLAVDQTVKIREAVTSDWYTELTRGRVWGVDGRQDYFKTGAGGSVYGVGALGTITGFGAGKKRDSWGGAIIIDDPLKASDARSETVRNKVNDWFTGTLLSRRNSDRYTPMLLIAQRLHPEDLVGYLKRTFASDWHFLEIPALPPNADETIWPETFSIETARQMQEVDPFAYFSQYQQEPQIPGGAIIKEKWWRYYSDLEDVDKRCTAKIITADTAYGVKDVNDYSVFQCWGFEGSKRAYLLDQVRGRWGYEELVAVAARFWEKHRQADRFGQTKPVYRMYIENKASGQSLVQQPYLFRKNGVNCHPWNPGQADKVSRVKEVLLSIYSGDVILPQPEIAGWVNDFIGECSSFTEDMSHVHDDQVDAMTMALLLWRGITRGATV